MPVVIPPGMPLTDQYTIMGGGWLDASHINVNIGGMTIFMDAASLQLVDSIGARSTIQFIVDDLNGTLVFANGEQTQIWSAGGLNILSAEQSSAENSSLIGFNRVNTGVTLSQSLTVFEYGLASLEVACDGTVSFQGAYVQVPGNQTYVGGVTYTASSWVNVPSGVPMQFQLFYTTGGGWTNLASFNFVGTGVWERVAVSAILPNMIPNGFSLIMLAQTDNVNTATTFYMDGLQIEQDRDVSPWHLGGTYGGTKLFGGVLVDAQRVRVGYSSVYQVQIQCVDWHYLADKRIVQSSWQYQTTGQIVRNIVDNILSQEGVTYQRGINLLNGQQSAIGSNDMTQFQHTGSGVTISQDTTTGVSGVGGGGTSLKVVTDGSATFQQVAISAPIASFIPGAFYMLSLWAKASTGTPTLRFYAEGNALLAGNNIANVNNSANPENITLSTSWVRYTFMVQLTTTFSHSSVNWTELGIDLDTGGTAQAITYWITGIQIEPVNPTVWSPGLAGGNLLNAQQADIESSDMTQFVVEGGGTTTLSQDTTTSWVDLSCLKVVTGGTVSGQGVGISVPNSTPVVIPANAYMIFSVYMKSTTAMTITLSVSGIATSPAVTLTPEWARYWFICQMGASPPSSVVFEILTSAAEAGTFWCDGIKVELTTEPTNFELGGLQQTVFDGVTLINYSAPYIFTSKAFDDLAQYSGFLWYIDANRMLWFQLPTTTAAPWLYDGTQGVYGSQTIELTSPLYRNTQWIYNIPDITGLQTETRHGDGTSQSITFSYPLAQAPKSLTLNGTAETVGIKGVDDVTHSKQWYWALNDATLAHDSTLTPIATTDSLVMSYIGRWTSAVYSQNQAQVATQAALEGTSGIVEEAHSDPTVTTAAQGFMLASALLARYGVQGQQITFDTRASGLLKGQMLEINMLSPGWGMSGTTVLALIEQIQTVINGPWFYYTVTAIVGPFNANWVQFYQQLSQQAQQGNSAPTNQITNILEAFTAAWTWACNLNVTVLTCPIIAPTLLCGPTVIVC